MFEKFPFFFVNDPIFDFQTRSDKFLGLQGGGGGPGGGGLMREPDVLREQLPGVVHVHSLPDSSTRTLVAINSEGARQHRHP